jgi:alkylation response protein AidB-like acyl-CoA dehydrogenase
MMSVDMNQAQSAMVQAATAFARDKLEGIAAELDHTGAYPKALVEGLAATGTLGMLLPEKRGGGGLGFETYVEAVQAISGACPAIVSIMNHHVLAADVIAQWGDEAQKGAVLPALAKGTRLATYALGETGPTLGIGPGALVATRQNGSLTLKGAKAFVRNAGVADIYVVFATLAEHVTTNGLFACIVEAGAPGMTVGPALETMGLNGCPVAHVTFEGTPVAESAVLKEFSAGPAIAERLLYLAAVAEGAQTVGIAMAAR